jgi:large subunit ribosomal protein L31
MKPGIHPDYVIRQRPLRVRFHLDHESTKAQELRLEICSNCNPFFTGKQRLIDSAGPSRSHAEWGKKKETATSGQARSSAIGAPVPRASEVPGFFRTR